MTTYESLMAGGVSGLAVVPGKPDESLLVRVQTGDKPHLAQFTEDELAHIIAWIEAGAPEE